MNPQRSKVKQFVLVLAGGSLVCTVLCLGLAFWAWMHYGTHVYTGSLFATTFFFFSVTIVLYEMSRPPRPLPSATEDGPAPGAPLKP